MESIVSSYCTRSPHFTKVFHVFPAACPSDGRVDAAGVAMTVFYSNDLWKQGERKMAMRL
jgi:hypothetical protein